MRCSVCSRRQCCKSCHFCRRKSMCSPTGRSYNLCHKRNNCCVQSCRGYPPGLLCPHFCFRSCCLLRFFRFLRRLSLYCFRRGDPEQYLSCRLSASCCCGFREHSRERSGRCSAVRRTCPLSGRCIRLLCFLRSRNSSPACSPPRGDARDKDARNQNHPVCRKICRNRNRNCCQNKCPGRFHADQKTRPFCRKGADSFFCSIVCRLFHSCAEP